MKIFITGIAGFIGYSLAKELLRLGHQVSGLDSLNSYYDVTLKQDRLSLISNDINFYKVDLLDYPLLLNVISKEKPDRLIHLAAQAGVRYSIDNPLVYQKSNNEGFLNILEVCRELSLPLVYASSSSVYGDSSKEKLSETEHDLNPKSFYAATKLFNEHIASIYSKIHHMSNTGLRFFTVYGPWGRPDMALFKFSQSILSGIPIDVYNQGNMFRDFTYIADIISGIIGVIYREPLPGFNDIFNLGCGNPQNLNYFIECLENSLGKKAVINYLPLQDGDVIRTSADIKKAVEVIGYKPRTHIEEGVQNFVNWYKSYYSIL